MVQKIIQSGDKKLREISKPVIKIDKKVKQLVQDLKDTLAVQNDPEGVGLAAPQIRKNLRVFVIDFKNLKRIIINPEILDIKKANSKSTMIIGASHHFFLILKKSQNSFNIESLLIRLLLFAKIVFHNIGHELFYFSSMTIYFYLFFCLISRLRIISLQNQ